MQATGLEFNEQIAHLLAHLIVDVGLSLDLLLLQDQLHVQFAHVAPVVRDRHLKMHPRNISRMHAST